MLLERLRGGPLPVVELARGMRVSRPAVSQHLKVLLEAQLVQVSVAGTRRFYRLDPRGISVLRSYMDSFLDEALGMGKGRMAGKE